MKLNTKNKWKIFLAIVALFIVIFSLTYSNILAKRLAQEELQRVQLVAKAIKGIADANENTDIGFLNEIIETNKSIPLIVTDEKGNITTFNNIDSAKANNSNWVKEKLLDMKSRYEPVKLVFGASNEVFTQYLYYDESYNLKLLRYFPIIQLLLIAVFILIAYMAFSAARNNERDRVWVGMAKETAHQMGTPLSSLLGWMEHLKMLYPDIDENGIAKEMELDIARLNLVADRFSKIGSNPELEEHSLNVILEETHDYFRKRLPKKVQLNIILPDENITAFVCKPLLNWVLENLIKNALDAMEGNGNITVQMREEHLNAIIDIKDTGKGMPKENFKTIFNAAILAKKEAGAWA
jgi:two-component system, sporulation sensor kinase D